MSLRLPFLCDCTPLTANRWIECSTDQALETYKSMQEDDPLGPETLAIFGAGAMRSHLMGWHSYSLGTVDIRGMQVAEPRGLRAAIAAVDSPVKKSIECDCEVATYRSELWHVCSVSRALSDVPPTGEDEDGIYYCLDCIARGAAVLMAIHYIAHIDVVSHGSVSPGAQ